jgi:hypothetical protein
MVTFWISRLMDIFHYFVAAGAMGAGAGFYIGGFRLRNVFKESL